MTAPADIQHNHSAIVTKNIGIQRYNQGQDTQEVYIRNIRNNARNRNIGIDQRTRSKEGIGNSSKKFRNTDHNDKPWNQAKEGALEPGERHERKEGVHCHGPTPLLTKRKRPY